MRLAYTLQAIGGGFLLAVLWFDLKFDLLAYAQLAGGSTMDADELEVVRSYYRRALSSERAGFPLIMPLMLITIAATFYTTIKESHRPKWLGFIPLLLVLPPVALAALRVIPNALELANSEADLQQLTVLAVAVLRDHLYCFVSISVFLLWQLARAARGSNSH